MTAGEAYMVLGLRPGATELEVKRAYRQAALQYHPDYHPGDPEAEARFKRVVEARDVLRGKLRPTIDPTQFWVRWTPAESPQASRGTARPARSRRREAALALGLVLVAGLVALAAVMLGIHLD